MSGLPVCAVPILGQYVQNTLSDISLGVLAGSMQMIQSKGPDQVHFLCQIKNSKAGEI